MAITSAQQKGIGKAGGFTLVELIISIAIGVTILGLVAAVYTTLVHSRLRYQSEAEVETEGNEAMNAIAQAVRDAQSINAPATSTSGTALSLAVSGSASPTLFSLSGSSMLMSLGGVNYLITGSSTQASNLSFSNLSASSTVGIVGIRFTLTEQAYSQNFYSSAALRLFKQ